MYSLLYRDFKLEGKESVASRLRRLAEASMTTTQEAQRVRKLIALYYASPYPFERYVDASFKLDWNAANNYNLTLNGREMVFLDINDLWLTSYLLGRGMESSYHFRYNRYNLPKLYKKLQEPFSKFVRSPTPLGLKTLRTLRIWAWEHDNGVPRSVIMQLIGRREWIFPFLSEEELNKQTNSKKPNYIREI